MYNPTKNMDQLYQEAWKVKIEIHLNLYLNYCGSYFHFIFIILFMNLTIFILYYYLTVILLMRFIMVIGEYDLYKGGKLELEGIWLEA